MQQNIVQRPAEASGTLTIGGDLKVHRLGFGAMRITGDGIWGPPHDRQEALAVLRRALELGINLIDTADSYGPEVSENLIAEALYPYPQDLVIATKGGLVRPGPDQWVPDGRPEHLREALEGLRRAYFERAAELGVRDVEGLQKLSIASKLVDELDRHVQNIIASGRLAAEQEEHLARIKKVGRRW